MGKKVSIFDMAKLITKESKKSQKSYNSGLLGEHLIASSYKIMTLKDLEKTRFLINEIIKEKKIYKRIQAKAKETETETEKDVTPNKSRPGN